MQNLPREIPPDRMAGRSAFRHFEEPASREAAEYRLRSLIEMNMFEAREDLLERV